MTRQETLTELLERLCEGTAEGAVLVRARALLAGDDRFPTELRSALDGDEDVADTAAALLAVLGEDPLGLGGAIGSAIAEESGVAELAAPDDGWVELARTLREGVARESGRVELSDAVLGALGAVEPVLPIEAAVAAGAGEVDVSSAVATLLGQHSAPIADAVLAEAGRAEVSAAVDLALGLSSLPIAASVRAEAGEVDVGRVIAASLGEAPVPVGAAVRAEAGEVDVAVAVMAQLGDLPLPIAEAVTAEAGAVHVADGVDVLIGEAWTSGLLDGELSLVARRAATRRLVEQPSLGHGLTADADLGRGLREGVAAEAGAAPQVWRAVAEQIGIEDADAVAGWDGAQVAAAVRAEAGDVDVVAAVLDRVRKSAAAPTPAAPSLTPANYGTWGAVALAAVALVMVTFGVPFSAEAPEESTPETIQFAQAGEVTVDALDYGMDTHVQVIQSEDGGPLIIWFDDSDEEGATL